MYWAFRDINNYPLRLYIKGIRLITKSEEHIQISFAKSTNKITNKMYADVPSGMLYSLMAIDYIAFLQFSILKTN